ncbi:type VI secretion system spike protein VgrG1b [soil metagenome]
MATTQDDRILKIKTPLGDDFLLIESMTATEGISQLYSIEAELVHAEEEEGYVPTTVGNQQILGKGVSISVELSDGTSRLFHGIVQQFAQGTRHVRFSFYKAVIVPQVWLLTQTRQSRIFQQMSVPDILRKVLTGFNVKFELQGTFEPRNYCVQYRESDWDFASRLMEEEGIFYFFEHSESAHQMIVANDPQSHPDCPGKSDIPYFHKVEGEDLVTAVHHWSLNSTYQTGKVTHWDHNFQLPGNKLDTQQPSRFNIADNSKLEVYDYPGGYARKYDGIDKSGGESSGDLQKVFSDKTKSSQIAMEALDVRHETGWGVGDCPAITAGYRFTMSNHPNNEQNGQYVITSANHNAVQSPSYVSDVSSSEPYQNNFTAIRHGSGSPTFRPYRETAKPIVHGSQTATVVGPGGEEIFTDKFGRVKVQFHWDRLGGNDAESSCWIRVAQSWAGNKWGMMFIPRIGMEVIVHFLDGDPDQPIITGCVYNPEMMPPYTLPDEKTKSTMKSNSSKGGGGFNEFRIEDKKGSEQIFIHAEKDKDIRVKNDCKEWIGNDRHMIIKNDQLEKVDKDVHLTVGGNVNQKIGDTLSIETASEIHEKAGQNFALEAGMGMHIKAGMTTVIEAGTSLTLKVGGNFININSGGIFIKGTMVMINSGGAAGSGSGCSPEPAKDPKEADTATAGKNAMAPKKSPPVPPKSFSPMAVSMQKAAKSGAPFCEVCNQ